MYQSLPAGSKQAFSLFHAAGFAEGESGHWTASSAARQHFEVNALNADPLEGQEHNATKSSWPV